MKETTINLTVILQNAKQKHTSYDIVKQICFSQQITLAELVRRRNLRHPDEKTTPQNLSNKLSRDSLKLSEFFELVDCAGYHNISFVDYENDNQLLDLQGNPLISKKNNSEDKESKKETSEQEKPKTFSDYLTEGFCEVRSQNFESAIVAGAKCEEAARWIEDNLNEYDYDETQEVVLYLAAAREYKIRVKPISNSARKIEML